MIPTHYKEGLSVAVLVIVASNLTKLNSMKINRPKLFKILYYRYISILFNNNHNNYLIKITSSLVLASRKIYFTLLGPIRDLFFT